MFFFMNKQQHVNIQAHYVAGPVQVVDVPYNVS